jgi:hypothetical protein
MLSGMHEDMKQIEADDKFNDWCADNITERNKLKHYQDIYAETMSKYNLQHGVDDSEALNLIHNLFPMMKEQIRIANL